MATPAAASQTVHANGSGPVESVYRRILHDLERLLSDVTSLGRATNGVAAPSSNGHGEAAPGDHTSPSVPGWVDSTIGLAGVAVRGVTAIGRRVSPLAELTLNPPILPERLRPQTYLSRLADRGRQDRADAEDALATLMHTLVPRVLMAVLDQIDLTAVVRDRVDLNALIKDVDLDAAVSGVDLDAIASRLDVDAVISHVDLDSAVAQVDLDGAVGRVDIEAIINRIDLEGIARDLIDRLDLAGIIRSSSGAMTSDAVRGVRVRSMEADERVHSAFDRLMARRKAHADGEGTPTLISQPSPTDIELRDPPGQGSGWAQAQPPGTAIPGQGGAGGVSNGQGDRGG